MRNKNTTYVLISELRYYDLQTDVFLLINLGYCAPIVLLLKINKGDTTINKLSIKSLTVSIKTTFFLFLLLCDLKVPYKVELFIV